MNLAELSWQTTSQLSIYLNANDNWKRTAEAFNISKNDIAANLERQLNPTEALLRELGNRLKTVDELLKVLDKLKIEKPQFVLKRKFKNVKFLSLLPDARHIVSHGDDVRLRCSASGFPYPNYQWFCNKEPITDATSSELVLDGSNLVQSGFYHCRIWNEVSDGEAWSGHYRKPGKTWRSEICTDCVEVTMLPFADLRKTNASRDVVSSAIETERLMAKIDSLFKDDDPFQNDPSRSQLGRHAKDIDQDCIATDKVALIICNSEYVHLPKLRTPACDAEVLAERLLTLNFKTVMLSDLNLAEMQRMIVEYKNLLGTGVYAIFYFVGHGFETRGQCYLLPVDAPSENYKCKDCLCAEHTLEAMQETLPSLNLILLDICRRFPPHNAASSDDIVQYKPRVNRNTVFGYATSLGEGAYEVRGEQNGIFMKYFKDFILEPAPVNEILQRVMRSLEDDPKAGDVQFPEVRTNLSRPRSLADPLIYSGHTDTFDYRTILWQEIHSLPDPVKIHLNKHSLMVTIWFDFCGHFSNMIYIFTSVSSIVEDGEPKQDEVAMEHLAFLTFPSVIDSTQTTVCTDMEEGVSVRTLLRHLQRLQGTLKCSLKVVNRKIDKVIAFEDSVELGELLSSKLGLCNGDSAS